MGKTAWVWARVCTEGPVFACRDILWENEDGRRTTDAG
ncbi:MAG: hypothetical protein HYV36_06305 [Lentisphaerae bacterium]|nr:hypothetical protein [Lentisphaerota bacterium]